MIYNARLDIKDTDLLMKEHGIQAMGPVQKYIDNECIKLMKPLTPFLSGILEKSTSSTVIGSGEIHQNAPYARFQYHGKLMVSSITGSSYATKGEKKVLTDTDLVHNKSGHPLAGPFWFERMKEKHKDDILEGAQKVAKRGK